MRARTINSLFFLMRLIWYKMSFLLAMIHVWSYSCNWCGESENGLVYVPAGEEHLEICQKLVKKVKKTRSEFQLRWEKKQYICTWNICGWWHNCLYYSYYGIWMNHSNDVSTWGQLHQMCCNKGKVWPVKSFFSFFCPYFLSLFDPLFPSYVNNS